MKPNKISARKRRSFGAEPAHDAEVDRDQPATVIDEQIARMHVGVEEAVAQSLAQATLNHAAAERRQVETLGSKRGVVVKRRAVDPFQREHFARRAVPVHRGHAEIGVLARVLRHFGKRRRFQPKIHFHRHRTGQRRHRLDRAQPLRFERKAFRFARGKKESVEIDLEAPCDARPQNFHRHGFAFAVFVDFGLMHLRDRGGGDGRAEARIDIVQRLVERLGDRGFRLRLRKRRHLVLQAFQIARDSGADHVRPGGHELAELDVSRPQLGKRGGEPTGAVFGGGPLDQAGERDRGPGRERHRPRIDQREHALAREHEAGAGKTGKMGDRRGHKRQPECSATTPPVIGLNETRRKPARSIMPAKAFGLGNLRIDSTRY